MRRFLLLLTLLAVLIRIVPSASAASYVFANTLSISIPTLGAASPYPSLINVSNATGVITDINVTLFGINHYYPDDLDILLKSPSGHAVLLMSDACGANLMLGVNLTFDDEAPTFLSNSGACYSGSYKPTDYTDTPNSFPPPAPNVYSFALSAFDGTNPNGVWELYVYDDTYSSANLGSISGGWRLEFTTAVVIPTQGNANPFPSRRTYSGITGSIADVNLRLNGLTHSRPDDLDILLRSPGGQTVMVMSDACGTTPLSNAVITLNDEAAAPLPNGGPCGAGEYRPMNYLDEGAENFGAPAPLGPYWGALSAFDGGSPNGTWELYIRDDEAGFSGWLLDWDLTITTTPTPPNLLNNPSFSSALGNGNGNWGVFGQIVSQVNGGVFEFYRNGASAGVLQRTGAAIPSGGVLHASFQLGNSSSVRKRAAILLHDSDFSDLAFCTFWIPPNAPMRTFTIATHTTEAWTNATFSLYASTNDGLPWLRFDNASLQYFPTFNRAETLCIDPLAPPTTGTFSSANLVANPNFNNFPIAPWTTFWNLSWQWSGGVFEFFSTAEPAGLVEQNTPSATPIGSALEASFLLGNSSNARKRVTVLIRRADWTDLQACTFWLPPNSPLQPYLMRTFAGSAWNATSITFYASTITAQGWTRLDNVFLRQRYDLNVHGTECYEPGSLIDNSTEWMLELLTDDVVREMLPELMPTAIPGMQPFVPDGALPEIPLINVPASEADGEAPTNEGSIVE